MSFTPPEAGQRNACHMFRHMPRPRAAPHERIDQRNKTNMLNLQGLVFTCRNCTSPCVFTNFRKSHVARAIQLPVLPALEAQSSCSLTGNSWDSIFRGSCRHYVSESTGADAYATLGKTSGGIVSGALRSRSRLFGRRQAFRLRPAVWRVAKRRLRGENDPRARRSR